MKSAALIVILGATGALAFAWGGRDEPEAPAAAPEQTPVQAQPVQDLPPGHPPIDGSEQGMPSLDGPLPPGHPPIAGEDVPPPPNEAVEPIAPAQNGQTIAQIVRDARTLEGKKVKVTARVMRSTPNVLGKTWLRVQDGSGSADKSDHELVVTTQATPPVGAAVGEIVELEGTVVRDKDLGSGYRYAVLLEDATVQVRTR